MNKYLLGLSGLVLAVAAHAADAPKAVLQTAVLQTVMLTKVNPQGLALWDITNNAMNDAGELDAKKMTPTKWARLAEIGKALEEGGKQLATSKGVIAAPPGARLQDDNPSGPSKSITIQGYLDAKPDLFRQRAKALQDLGAKTVVVAGKKDLKTLNQISEDLDGVCEACHKDFWYPEQKK